MSNIAIIGGTGLTKLAELEIIKHETVDTAFGKPSEPLTYGKLFGRDVIFLPRHGGNHTIPPHMINYRANIRALKDAGVEKIIAIAACGAMDEAFVPTSLAIPDQIIDYTWGRKHTFFEDSLDEVTHIDFTNPYDEALRQALIKSCQQANVQFSDYGTYAAAQGPRLETAAEIKRMEHDGCTMVGMTGMPEAALARELGMAYACCAVSVNWAAGKTEAEITMEEIIRCLGQGMGNIRGMFEKLMTIL